MPLSRATPRRHIHTRLIDCRGYARDDGLWDIEATLSDTKTYSFANQDRGGINAGEPIHGMAIRLTLDDDLVVAAAEASTDAAPYSICGTVTAAFYGLVGLKVGKGWRKGVLERFGRTAGCTHLTDLLTGPMAVVAYQTVHPARSRRESADAPGRRPAMIDTCHALAADGPIVERQWPDFFTGERD